MANKHVYAHLSETQRELLIEVHGESGHTVCMLVLTDKAAREVRAEIDRLLPTMKEIRHDD